MTGQEKVILDDTDTIRRGCFGSASKNQVGIFREFPRTSRSIPANGNGPFLAMTINTRNTKLMPIQGFHIDLFTQIVVTAKKNGGS